jgi:hypothetical protein
MCETSILYLINNQNKIDLSKQPEESYTIQSLQDALIKHYSSLIRDQQEEKKAKYLSKAYEDAKEWVIEVQKLRYKQHKI